MTNASQRRRIAIAIARADADRELARRLAARAELMALRALPTAAYGGGSKPAQRAG